MSSGVWKQALQSAMETYEHYLSNDLDVERIARLHGMISCTEMVDPTEITEKRILDYLAVLKLTSLGLSDDEVNKSREAYSEVIGSIDG